MSVQQLMWLVAMLVVDAVIILVAFAAGLYKGVTAPESVRAFILGENVAVYENCFPEQPYTEYEYVEIPFEEYTSECFPPMEQ